MFVELSRGVCSNLTLPWARTLARAAFNAALCSALHGGRAPNTRGMRVGAGGEDRRVGRSSVPVREAKEELG